MRILGFDSCGKTASVAVYDGKVAGEIYIDTEQTHSMTLLPSAEWLLSNLGLKISDMDYIAATIGPGSFTGVRIGMAAVKGMAAGARLNCIGVSSLYAAAYALRDTDAFVCAVMDARCAQVYNANFRVNNGILERVCEDRAIAISELMEEISCENNILFVGDGAELCYEKFTEKGVRCAIGNRGIRGVTAANVVSAAAEMTDSAVTPESFAINYIRVSQAERELKARTLKKEQEEKI